MTKKKQFSQPFFAHNKNKKKTNYKHKVVDDKKTFALKTKDYLKKNDETKINKKKFKNKTQTNLFCVQSFLISVKRIANVSRVTSLSNCFLACRNSPPNASPPYAETANPPAPSSPTAQSTNGS